MTFPHLYVHGVDILLMKDVNVFARTLDKANSGTTVINRAWLGALKVWKTLLAVRHSRRKELKEG